MRRLALLFMAVVIDCRPDLDPGGARVSSIQVLAVRADPPEARPGVTATYRALVAQPRGQAEPDMRWRWCRAAKPVGENNAVSAACLETSSLVEAGVGPMIAAAPPADACALFGPDAPSGGFRPRDPDTTGGYYAPLRLDVAGADTAFYLARVMCNLAGAPTDIARQFARGYVPNANPHLLPLSVQVDGAPSSLDSIRVGARVALQVSWPPEDAETYLYFDAERQELSARRESMRVAWHATGGAFDVDATGRDEQDLATQTNNAWSAAASAGDVRMWIILRDDRGGVDFAIYDARVIP